MRILLVCAAGMSTSLLTNNMKKFADAGDVIDALPVEDLKAHVTDYDVVLVGPQIRYKLPEVEKVCSAAGVKSALMDMLAYGRMDGQAAMTQARSLVQP